MSQVKNPQRSELLRVLNGMTDEAFSYVLLWSMGMANVQYPDGLGGFRPESQASIAELRKVAKAIYDARSAAAMKQGKTAAATKSKGKK